LEQTPFLPTIVSPNLVFFCVPVDILDGGAHSMVVEEELAALCAVDAFDARPGFYGERFVEHDFTELQFLYGCLEGFLIHRFTSKIDFFEAHSEHIFRHTP
jgi:hypothetical protein